VDPAQIGRDLVLLAELAVGSAEVVAAVVAMHAAVLAGVAVHRWQRSHAEVLPTLPSHAEALRHAPDEATRFFAAVHDLTMTVTEAWNAARARHDTVALEEVLRRDRLATLHEEVEAACSDLLAVLHGYRDCAGQLPLDLSEGVWRHDTRHNYRTETYTTTTSDGKGGTRTQVKTRQVYDSTDHSFTFRPAAAEELHERLRRWLAAFGRAHLPLLGLHAREVDIGRLAPAERSFLERLVRHTVLEDDEATVSDEALSTWVNQWLLGTRIDRRLATFRGAGEALGSSVEAAFVVIHDSDPVFRERTRSRTHRGPPGFRAHQRLHAQLVRAGDAWGAVERMMGTAVHRGRELVAWASDPGEVEDDHDYMAVAVEIYEAAFPDSELRVDQLPTWGPKLGAGAVAGLVGGLAAYLLHPAGPLSW